jgi:hypothetical protein
LLLVFFFFLILLWKWFTINTRRIYKAMQYKHMNSTRYSIQPHCTYYMTFFGERNCAIYINKYTRHTSKKESHLLWINIRHIARPLVRHILSQIEKFRTFESECLKFLHIKIINEAFWHAFLIFYSFLTYFYFNLMKFFTFIVETFRMCLLVWRV